jgi:hypothetical protein
MILTNEENSNFNDLQRQGVEISDIKYIRGILFPKILANYSTRLVRDGENTENKKYFDDTLQESNSKNLNLDDSRRLRNKILMNFEQRNLGQLDFTDSDASRPGFEPFRESIKFNPVEFLSTDQSNYPFSILEKQRYLENYFTLDGVLEPLAIRSLADFSNINFPLPYNSIKGNIVGQYSQDFEGNGCLIENKENLNKNTVIPFFDYAPENHIDGIQSMLNSGVFSNERKFSPPFKDSSGLEKKLIQYLELSIQDVMNNSISYDEELNDDEIFSSAGFSYSITNLNYKIRKNDSIAYNNLMK